MANYGLPYMGSKSKLVDWVIGILPPNETLVDLFAGGCAITHAALLSNKWNTIIANDITDSPKLFKECLDGSFSPMVMFPDREQFFALKNVDPYIRICSSFGNDCRTYLYGRDIESIKTCAEEMLAAETLESRNLLWHDFIRELKAYVNQRGRIDALDHLDRIQRLNRLNSLSSVKHSKNLEITQSSYDEVVVPDNATVYCDPPYLRVKQYQERPFDHEGFYEWLRNVDYPVYVSEYFMPEDFICIDERDHYSTRSTTSNRNPVVEGIFIHERWANNG